MRRGWRLLRQHNAIKFKKKIVQVEELTSKQIQIELTTLFWNWRDQSNLSVFYDLALFHDAFAIFSCMALHVAVECGVIGRVARLIVATWKI